VGASGVVGPHVVAALTERGSTVRVLARGAARARTLLPAGTEVRQGDPTVPGDLLAAADGAEALFLLTAHDPRMVDVQLRIIRTLRHTGIRIVKLSATGSAITPDGPDTGRQHWEIEQVLAASGKPYVILRPNAFMQGLIDRMVLPAALHTGTIPNAIGTAGVSMIDARDVGECAAEALHTTKWDGTTMTLTGPRAVTFTELAEIVGERIGARVGTTQTTPAEVRGNLEKLGMAGWEAGHIEAMFELYRRHRSEFVSEDVSAILGRPPSTVDDYITRHPGLTR
jgi:uncharacterized protein YbjT (DUF2867 family)